jgi:hypothetical protein
MITVSIYLQRCQERRRSFRPTASSNSIYIHEPDYPNLDHCSGLSEYDCASDNRHDALRTFLGTTRRNEATNVALAPSRALSAAIFCHHLSCRNTLPWVRGDVCPHHRRCSSGVLPRLVSRAEAVADGEHALHQRHALRARSYAKSPRVPCTYSTLKRFVKSHQCHHMCLRPNGHIPAAVFGFGGHT